MQYTFERFFFIVEEVKVPVPTQLLTVPHHQLKPTLQEIPQHIKKVSSGTQSNTLQYQHIDSF